MKSILALAITPLALVSCAPQELTGDTVSRGEVGQANTVRVGTIESVKYVKIQGGQTAGSVIGGIVGGVLGSEVGGGSGNTLGAIAGAGLGAAAGSSAEQKIMNRQGVELIVNFDDGVTESFVQEHSEREIFNVGDRVRVVYGSKRTRVTR